VPEVFHPYFDERLAGGKTLVAADRVSGEVLGWSSYALVADDPATVEIGWTFLVRSRWGGLTNAEMKALMIGHACQHFDAVQLRVGVNNLRSQRAVEKIGGRRQRGRHAVDTGSGSADYVMYRIDNPNRHNPNPRGPLPAEVRRLLEGPAVAHLVTLRADGSPRSTVVWVDIEGDLVVVCTDANSLKAKDMRRNPQVAISLTARDDPYDVATIRGSVIEERSDPDLVFKDRLSHKYIGRAYPRRTGDRSCFFIVADSAHHRRVSF
jgi:PPOX class probable F420-dependent enzyme